MSYFCIDCKAEVSRREVKRCRRCESNYHRGSNHHSYQGGKGKSGIRGYIVVLMPEHPYANKKGRVLEHRLVMEKHLGRYLRKDEFVDHKNNVANDNRLENLRLCTKSQNSINRGLSYLNRTGYKGVGIRGGKYLARIKYQQKLITIGSFDNKEEAARAYDKKALELFGEFAYLNFPQK